MAYEQKDMTFSMFPNKHKNSDTSPNLTGTAIINGVAYFIDGWTNQDRNGNKYIAGKLKPKQERAQEMRRDAERPSYAEQSGGGTRVGRDLDDEIPFHPEFR